jgi:hypothetical protein
VNIKTKKQEKVVKEFLKGRDIESQIIAEEDAGPYHDHIVEGFPGEFLN